jgi:hypothetical protein
MATTTPNFGWSVPTSTDLVKDGATAIETLGDSIDASFVGLKGGTTGQVLSKTSGTDLAFTWVAQDDSNAIQNAIVDAKGDLIGATAADTPARLAVGANGTVLTADSTAATGLAWTTVGGGGTYTAYTPTFTNFTLGNGTINFARYVQIGKFVTAYGKVTLGSTSSMGTNPFISLPVTATANNNAIMGNLTVNDQGTQTYYGYVYYSSTTVAQLIMANVAGTYPVFGLIQSTTPMTWVNTDSFTWRITYEAA